MNLGIHAKDVGGPLTADTVWTATAPIRVTNDVTVLAGVTLTIEAGTLLQLAPKFSIAAQAGGAIVAEGTATRPVLFRSLDGANNWGRIGAMGANARLTLRHADLERGQAAVLSGASGLFEFCSFHDYHPTGTPTLYNQPILVTEQATSLTVRACHFRNYYETLFRLGGVVIEDSLFEEISGDGIDFDTAAPGSVIRRCTIRHGSLTNVDAIDLGSDSAGVLVEHCLMHDFPFDKGVSIGEHSTNITVRACLIYAVETGVAVKDSSYATIVNNTVADSAFGFRLYEKVAGQGPGHAIAWNNILWNNTNSISLLNGSTLALRDSDVSGAGVYPGDGNFNANPLFRNAVGRDYRLASGSPALTAGGGSAIGALFPVGSILVDTDGDGLPDPWEMTYDFDFNDAADAMVDRDHDGLSNRTEFLAGTDPLDAASVLKAGVRLNANGEIQLEFRAAPNRSYAIEFCAAADTGDWRKLSEIPPASSARMVQWPIAVDAAVRFFRLVVDFPR